jgi:hypothetical protein
MTIENDALCDDLRAWMRSPTMGLQEYSSDPSVQRRVGRMLANFSTKFFLQAPRRTVVNQWRGDGLSSVTNAATMKRSGQKFKAGGYLNPWAVRIPVTFASHR